jgi:hypothetical protein
VSGPHSRQKRDGRLVPAVAAASGSVAGLREAKSEHSAALNEPDFAALRATSAPIGQLR